MVDYSKIYSKKEVSEALARIVGIKEREIGYWTDLGIVIPSIANPKGRGFTRFYSVDNLIEFGVAKQLAMGLNLKTVKRVMEKMREASCEARSLERIRIFLGGSQSMEVAVELIKKGEVKKLDPGEDRVTIMIDVSDTVRQILECANAL